MIELLTELAKISPLIALMVVAIIYFIKKETGYKAEITQLQAELRESEKDNLTALYKVTNIFETVLAKNDVISKEIESLKEYIKERLDRIEKT